MSPIYGYGGGNQATNSSAANVVVNGNVLTCTGMSISIGSSSQTYWGNGSTYIPSTNYIITGAYTLYESNEDKLKRENVLMKNKMSDLLKEISGLKKIIES